MNVTLTGDSAKSPELEYNKRNCMRWNSSFTSCSSVLHISTSKCSKLKIRIEVLYCCAHAQIQWRYTEDLKHFHDIMLITWQYHDGVPRVICVWPRALISGRPKWCYLTSSILTRCLFYLDSVLALNLLKFLCKYRNTNPRYMCYFFNHVGERLLDIVAQCILGPRLSRSLNTQAVIRWDHQSSRLGQ